MNGIWVRSQDKRALLFCSRLMLEYGNRSRIINYYGSSESGEDYNLLGEYSSDHRAIEVLDEIQRRIGNPVVQLTEYGVFQMPET